MSETSPYLLTIRPSSQSGRNTCVWVVERDRRLDSGLYVASPVLEAVGFCAIQPTREPDMSQERRILLGLDGPGGMVSPPRIRPPIEVPNPQYVVEDPTVIVTNFTNFRSSHPNGVSVQAPPTALPPELATAFEDAYIYIPGPLDGRTGSYI